MHIQFSRTFSTFRPAILAIIGALILSGMGLTKSEFISSAIADEHEDRKLEVVKGDLYQFTSGGLSGVVLVSNEGIAIGDPLDTESAQWLQAELKTRFDLPIKYVFYTHMGPERSEGGHVFASAGATIIAHENALDHTDMSQGLSAPAIVFSSKLTLSLDGNRIVLMFSGKSLRDDILFAHFPDEDAVFTSDLVAVERVPSSDLSHANFPEWFATIDRMNRQQFVYLLDGYGGVGIQNDAIEHGYYLRELHARVTLAKDAATSIEGMQKEIAMERYRGWAGHADQVANNVETMLSAISR